MLINACVYLPACTAPRMPVLLPLLLVLSAVCSLPLLSCCPQAPSRDDEGASSSGEEEDAEAKAARTDKQIYTIRQTPAIKRKEEEARLSATDSKRKKKRARDGDAGKDEEEDRSQSRLAVSGGPLAVEADDMAADQPSTSKLMKS